MIILDSYLGTLIKLINVNNMAEIWGTLISVNENDIVLEKSIIILNRAVADLASTFDDIIQYKYTGSTLGANIATPLGPVFNNTPEGSVVNLNTTNWIVVPFYSIDQDLSVDNGNKTDSDYQIANLINSMNAYIDDIYNHYIEMGKYFLPPKDSTTTLEETNE